MDDLFKILLEFGGMTADKVSRKGLPSLIYGCSCRNATHSSVHLATCKYLPIKSLGLERPELIVITVLSP